MSKITIQEIINWCDKKSEEGSELTLSWSGYNFRQVKFFLDGITCNEPEPEKLRNLIDSQIDYFGRINEFVTEGKAIYEASCRSFVGIDRRVESESESKEGIYTTSESNIEIWLPINTQFNTLIIKTEGHYCKVEAKIAQLDGSSEPKYKRIENMLEKILPNQFDDLVNLALNHSNLDHILNFDHTYEIPRESFIEADGVLLYYIKTIGFFKKIITESKVEIDLTKILNDE